MEQSSKFSIYSATPKQSGNVGNTFGVMANARLNTSTTSG
jgi:hypothetical protein